MKKQSPAGSLVVALVAAVAVALLAAGRDVAAASPQTRCPVMGGPINKSVYVDHGGKRVYFCCPGCVETFKKDPDGYIKKLEAGGVVLESAPKAEAPKATPKVTPKAEASEATPGPSPTGEKGSGADAQKTGGECQH